MLPGIKKHKIMLYKLFWNAVNMYQYPGEGWDEAVDCLFDELLDLGKDYIFLLEVMRVAWEVA